MSTQKSEQSTQRRNRSLNLTRHVRPAVREPLTIEEIEQLDDAELRTTVSSYLSSRDLAQFLGLTLSQLTNGTRVKRRLMQAVFLELRDNSSKMDARAAEETGTTLCFQVETAPTEQINELVEFALQGLGKPGVHSWSNVLGSFLSALASRETVCLNGVDMTGAEYKGEIIETICNAEWDVSNSSAILKSFIGLNLVTEQLQQVVKKASECMYQMEIEDVPSMVYQMLLLTYKHPSVAVLRKLDAYFSGSVIGQVVSQRKSGNFAAMMQRTEQTVIMHITEHAHNHPIADEIKRIIKASTQCPSLILSKFFLSMSLAITELHRNEMVGESLKDMVVRSIWEEEKKNSSWWLRAQIAGGERPTDMLRDVVDNCGDRKHQIVEGVIQLAMALLTVLPNSPKAGPGVALKAHSLGASLLVAMVKKQRSAISPVLKLLHHACLENSYTTPYADCLNCMFRDILGVAREGWWQVQSLVEMIPSLGPEKGKYMARALRPLLGSSRKARDLFVMVMRKNLFCREARGRQASVHGLLQLLALTSSQGKSCASQDSFGSQFILGASSQSSQMLLSSEECEALSLELLGILKRCLSLNAAMKTVLYEGLYPALCCSPDLCGHVLATILLPQLELYYEERVNALPPLKFEKVVGVMAEDEDEPELKEPLGKLIHTTQLILGKFKQKEEELMDERHRRVASEVDDILKNLCARMSECDLEDFSLDKEDLTLDTPENKEKFLQCQEICHSYEALMEYTFMKDKEYLSSEVLGHFLILFSGYKKVAKHVSRAKKSTKGRGKKAEGTVKRSDFHSNLSLKFLNAIFSTLYGKPEHAQPQALHELRGNWSLQKFLVGVILENIQRTKSSACNGIGSESSFNLHCSIVELLFEFCACHLELGPEDDQWPVIESALEYMVELFKLVQNQDLDKIHVLISALNGEDGSSSSALKKLQNMLNKLEECKDQQCLVVPLAFLMQKAMGIGLDSSNPSITSPVSASSSSSSAVPTSSFPNPSSRSIQTEKWLENFCQDHELEDKKACRSLLELLISSVTRTKQSFELVDNLAKRLLTVLGDNEDRDVEECTAYKIVSNGDTAHEIVLMLVKYLEDVLEMVDIAMAYLRRKNFESGSETPAEFGPVENNICRQLLKVSRVMMDLLDVKVLDVACSDALLKFLIRFYNCCNVLAKYFVDCYNKKRGSIEGRKFGNLAKGTGKSLKTNVESFIAYVDNNIETTKIRKTTEKKSGKGRLPESKKPKLLKESRRIPGLIFAMEQYEKTLLLLSKKAKVDFDEWIKNSNSRDFRIKLDRISNGMDVDEVPEESDATGQEEEGMDVEGNSIPGSSRTNENKNKGKSVRGKRKLHSSSDDDRVTKK